MTGESANPGSGAVEVVLLTDGEETCGGDPPAPRSRTSAEPASLL